MSQYLILIYEDEAAWATAEQAHASQIMGDHQTFGEKNAAVLRGGNALEPTTTATSLRSDGAGGFAVTDGAFAEAKEALGGYYVIEAADLDEAVAVAKQVPAVFGGVEVRPIRTFE
ncbi:MAG: hypothetical protein QOE59_1683 [Actinomycetota bacterium]|jgi:hypothetical protein|nr:hypothetical protein [Actinomycetota bacterium]